ncbi:MAG: hypothetical protein R2940_18455 [Syntrophotaleaceae bacterium]
MARFRTRPNIIEAFRVSQRTVIHPADTLYQNIFVVYPGEYLCTDTKGYKFPCRPEIFEMLYEPETE